MIKKYSFGTAFKTDAVVKEIIAEKDEGTSRFGKTKIGNNFLWEYTLKNDDIVYGLGEANRGINKRGWQYQSWCSDDPNHTENKESLYGAHNFILVFSPSEKTAFGMFFDYPSKITFDIGYTKQDRLGVYAKTSDIDIYEITTNKQTKMLHSLVKEFRGLIGESYIPPRWAFGLGQSRWGYKTEKDIREVYEGYKKERIPLDAIYLDIDYMADFKDFTIDSIKFPNLKKFQEELKQDGVRLVPIIDAGVKIEKNFDVYEEGVKNNFFCKRADESNFVAGVWPGKTHFPDFLNEDAQTWFGKKYKILTDAGIEGFWNDMNEPAIFYSEEGLKETFTKFKNYQNKNLNIESFFEAKELMNSISNNEKDYKRFYHKVNASKVPAAKKYLSEKHEDDSPLYKESKDGSILVRHDIVHNLFGYKMSQSAGVALKEISPKKRTLLFSRSSYIGMHRYAGIWMGDNQSWWQHILLNIKMLPSLNMCGFLYTGADTGGFGSNATEDLLLRWQALSVFTPLFRNHSALGTRKQEAFRFENTKASKSIIELRYALIPYLYSEYMKAALENSMMFRALAFDYPEDKRTYDIEDQLLLGNEIMIAPIYTQNAKGRMVYLPESMLKIVWKNGKIFEKTLLKKGDHHILCSEEEVVFFIKENCILPLAKPEQRTDSIDSNNLMPIAAKTSDKTITYNLYCDDGYTMNPKKTGTMRIISV